MNIVEIFQIGRRGVSVLEGFGELAHRVQVGQRERRVCVEGTP
jgi:hypothetical protein